MAVASRRLEWLEQQEWPLVLAAQSEREARGWMLDLRDYTYDPGMQAALDVNKRCHQYTFFCRDDSKRSIGAPMKKTCTDDTFC